MRRTAISVLVLIVGACGSGGSAVPTTTPLVTTTTSTTAPATTTTTDPAVEAAALLADAIALITDGRSVKVIATGTRYDAGGSPIGWTRTLARGVPDGGGEAHSAWWESETEVAPDGSGTYAEHRELSGTAFAISLGDDGLYRWAVAEPERDSILQRLFAGSLVAQDQAVDTLEAGPATVVTGSEGAGTWSVWIDDSTGLVGRVDFAGPDDASSWLIVPDPEPPQIPRPPVDLGVRLIADPVVPFMIQIPDEAPWDGDLLWMLVPGIEPVAGSQHIGGPFVSVGRWCCYETRGEFSDAFTDFFESNVGGGVERNSRLVETLDGSTVWLHEFALEGDPPTHESRALLAFDPLSGHGLVIHVGAWGADDVEVLHLWTGAVDFWLSTLRTMTPDEQAALGD